MNVRTLVRRMRGMKWISPGCFTLCAICIVIVFVTLHLMGWRKQTGIFSGTFPAGHSAQVVASFQAILYIVFYFGTVILSPILLIASSVFGGLMVLAKRRSCKFNLKM